MNADILVGDGGLAATVFPVISGYHIQDARVENLAVDGNRAENPTRVDGCRNTIQDTLEANRVQAETRLLNERSTTGAQGRLPNPPREPFLIRADPRQSVVDNGRLMRIVSVLNTKTMHAMHSRRRFINTLTAGSALLAVPGALAEALTLTPAQTEGPFYPDHLPLDTDNDLLIVNDAIRPAVGDVTWLSGRVLDRRGDPVRNALVEIWQCDANGAYLHSRSGNAARRDGNFQGFGRFLTGSSGEYGFRTIKPVPYPGRTPHIHFAIKLKGRKELVTQCYIEGHPGNERDGIWRGIRSAEARRSVTVPFQPLPGSKAGELAARFDIVLGLTPEDPAG